MMQECNDWRFVLGKLRELDECGIVLTRIDNEMVCIIPSGRQEDLEEMLGLGIPDNFPINVVSNEELVECCQCGALDYVRPEKFGRDPAIQLPDGKFLCKACARLDPHSTIAYFLSVYGDGFSVWDSYINPKTIEILTNFRQVPNFTVWADGRGKKSK